MASASRRPFRKPRCSAGPTVRARIPRIAATATASPTLVLRASKQRWPLILGETVHGTSIVVMCSVLQTNDSASPAVYSLCRSNVWKFRCCKVITPRCYPSRCDYQKTGSKSCIRFADPYVRVIDGIPPDGRERKVVDGALEITSGG